MDKLDIAVHQFNKAIDLFIEERDFICAITLAGATEEILGKEIERASKTSACSDLSSSLHLKYPEYTSPNEIRNKHLNNIRNTIKHFNNESEREVNTDWEAQAIQMLARCCINIIKLEIEPTEQFHDFIKWYQHDERYKNI